MGKDKDRKEGLLGEAIKTAKHARKLTSSHVEGLTEAEFAWRPAKDANPVLWILWHIAEVQDSVLWALDKSPPNFPLGRSALAGRDPRERLPLPAQVLEYWTAAHARYLDRLQSLTEKGLDQAAGEGPWQGTVGSLIALPPRHEIYHAGQIAYIRRLMGKPVADRNQNNPFR